MNEATASKATLLNAKTAKYQSGVDNTINPLSPEDIAYALANLKRITKFLERYDMPAVTPELGALLFRVKWAHQDLWIDNQDSETNLLKEVVKLVKAVVDHPDALVHQRLAELTLRELEIIRPLRVKQKWKGSDAEKHTDRKGKVECPECKTPLLYTPGSFVTCYNKACSGRRRLGKPFKFQFMRLRADERRRWANVANYCSSMGMADGETILYANDVLAGRKEFNGQDIPVRWEAKPEMCPACLGARERNHGNRIVECPCCSNGHRLWKESERRRYVFRGQGEHGRRPWERMSKIFQRDIKATLIQVEADTLAEVKRRTK